MNDHSRVRGPIRSRVLRTHLEFEAQRLNLDIELSAGHGNGDIVGENHAFVCLPQAGEAVDFELQVPGSNAVVRLPVTLPQLDDRELVTLETESSEHPLAVVDGHRLYLFFDVDELFGRPADIAVQGDIEPSQAARRLFEAIVPKGLDRVRENIQEQGYQREREAFARMKLQGWEDRHQQWQSDLRYNESDLESACRQVERLSRACAELRQKIHAYAEHTRIELKARAVEEFDQLRKMTPKPFEDITLDNGLLRIQTGPVVLEHNSQIYEMGRFELQVRLSDFRLRIKAYEDNRVVDDYFHPHLSVEGVPCWGNIAPAVSQLIGERELGGLLPVIWRFLTSYNDENPYIPIDRWDPDYDPDAVFEECFEDAHAYFDCIACTRRQCPFYDSRFDRCWDRIRADADWRRCIDCDRCHHSSEARERLAEASTTH